MLTSKQGIFTGVSVRVKCDHGFYKFYPVSHDDLQRFTSLHNITLVKSRDFYTFPLLAELGTFSIRGLAYGGAVAIFSFQGEPWEVMRKNNLVYDMETKLILPKSSVIKIVKVLEAGNYYFSDSNIIQAGSITTGAQRVLSFDGVMDMQGLALRMREVSFV